MNDQRMLIVADPESAARAAADHIGRALAAGVAARGRADWATTGGSTAPALYRAMLEEPLRDSVPWQEVHVWWGDDRFVPRDHPHSNVKPVDDILLDIGGRSMGQATSRRSGVPIQVDHLHPFKIPEGLGAGRDPDEVARELAVELADEQLPLQDGYPVLDVVALGIGPDGHILSVFPGSSVFDLTTWTAGVPAPTHVEPHLPRVTMHPSIVRVAREVVLVATGPGKAEILATVLGAVRDERRWPAQVARLPQATWILDEAAAILLPR